MILSCVGGPEDQSRHWLALWFKPVQHLILTRVAVRPVAPQPRAGLAWNVRNVFLFEVPIDVECSIVCSPIDAVLVDSGNVGWSSSCGRSGALTTCCGLISKPNRYRVTICRALADVISAGVWVRDVFNVSLLVVITVEKRG